MKISIDTESLKKLIEEEVETAQTFGCFTGISLIGTIKGVQIQLVLTNNKIEYMDATGNLSITDKDIIQCQE